MAVSYFLCWHASSGNHSRASVCFICRYQHVVVLRSTTFFEPRNKWVRGTVWNLHPIAVLAVTGMAMCRDLFFEPVVRAYSAFVSRIRSMPVAFTSAGDERPIPALPPSNPDFNGFVSRCFFYASKRKGLGCGSLLRIPFSSTRRSRVLRLAALLPVGIYVDCFVFSFGHPGRTAKKHATLASLHTRTSYLLGSQWAVYPQAKSYALLEVYRRRHHTSHQVSSRASEMSERN